MITLRLRGEEGRGGGIYERKGGGGGGIDTNMAPPAMKKGRWLQLMKINFFDKIKN